MKKKTKIIITVIAVSCIIAGGIAYFIGSSSEIPTMTSEDMDFANDVVINEISSYSGPYFEDGSNEKVSKVMQITVTNTGVHDYQLAFIRIKDADGKEYTFKITSLMHGEKMVVLEENRASYNSMIKLESISAENVAVFGDDLSIHSDKFLFMSNDDVLTIGNDTDTALNNICVYYKNYSNEIAQGGITYRISIPVLAAGESAEISTGHFDSDSSRIIFVTYE